MEQKQLTTPDDIFPLMSLPKDMMQLIVSFLDSKSLLNLRRVNSLLEFISRNIFLKTVASNNTIAHISCGDTSSYLAKTNGTVYACGGNQSGQLGMGDDINRATPLRINLKNVGSLASSSFHAFAVTRNGNLFAWGANDIGQLGLGGFNSSQFLPQVVISLKNVHRVTTGNYHALALTQNGILYAWGLNTLGQLGLGNATNFSSPQVVKALINVANIKAGAAHSVAVIQDGTLYTWGYNQHGELGLGHNNNCNTPQEVRSLKNIKDVTAGKWHNLAVTQNGILYAWGQNVHGQLGIGHTTDCNSPQEIKSLKNVVSIVAGIHSLALIQNGTLYTWGANKYGQLGLGHNNNCNIPQEVKSLKDIMCVSAGYDFTLAVTKQGNLYAWGSNLYGQLGFGTITAKEQMPKQVTITNSVNNIVESISKREHKRQRANAELRPETQQALLNQLNTFLSNSGSLNGFSFELPVKFFAPKRAVTLALGLKNVISSKSGIECIESEIANYKIANLNSIDANKEDFEACLDNLSQVLVRATTQLADSIKTELLSMTRK